jgi:hypothetical protein
LATSGDSQTIEILSRQQFSFDRICDNSTCHCISKPQTTALVTRQAQRSSFQSLNIGPSDSTVLTNRCERQVAPLTKVNNVLA